MNFIKTFGVILRSLVTWVSSNTTKITDFNPGSAVRTLLDSIALQLEEFYFDLHQAILYAISTSIYEAFGFTKQDITYATGTVTVTFQQEVPLRFTIPEGWLFFTNPYATTVLYYESTEAVVVEKGTFSVEVPVRCTTPGVIGNIGIGLITNTSTNGWGISSVTNDTPMTGGQEAQTDSELKVLFQEYIRSLSKGTRQAIAYGAKTVPGVTGVYVDDEYIGFVRVYVHDENGELPDALKAAVEQELINWRAAGIEVQVLPIITHTLDFTVDVTMVDGVDLVAYSTSIKQVVLNYVNGFSVGQDFYVANVIGTVQTAFNNYVLNVTLPDASDVVVDNHELIRAGEITVNTHFATAAMLARAVIR